MFSKSAIYVIFSYDIYGKITLRKGNPINNMKESPILFSDILLISKHTDKRIIDDLKECPVKKIEYLFLFELYRAGGDCSYEQIIDSTYRHKSTISNIITRLEQEGCVVSYSEPNVKIKKRVRIMPKGEEIAKKGILNDQIWNEKLQARLNEAENERIKTYFNKIYYNLKKYDISNIHHYPDFQSLGYSSGYIKKRIQHIAFSNDRWQLEMNQKFILIHMAYCEGECTYKELEAAVQVAQSVIVRQMKKLSDAGYVLIKTDQNDHRVKLGTLTEQGSYVGNELLKEYMDAEALSISDFTAEEIKDLMHLLQEVLKSIEL